MSATAARFTGMVPRSARALAALVIALRYSNAICARTLPSHFSDRSNVSCQCRRGHAEKDSSACRAALGPGRGGGADRCGCSAPAASCRACPYCGHSSHAGTLAAPRYRPQLLPPLLNRPIWVLMTHARPARVLCLRKLVACAARRTGVAIEVVALAVLEILGDRAEMTLVLVNLTIGRDRGDGHGRAPHPRSAGDGHLDVASMVGRGTTFTLTFPALPDVAWVRLARRVGYGAGRSGTGAGPRRSGPVPRR
jgi:hypothetical protein